MDRLLRTATALTLWRIALLYVVLALCRGLFWLYNAETIGPVEEIGSLLAGALKFDTASVVYADLLFVVLSLLPLHLRERPWYQSMLFWYYTVVNGVLVVAANLSDAVYFRYAQKRFTADEIFFADNSNSLQLALKFMGENWYMVLAAAALTALLAAGFRRRTRIEPLIRNGAAYYLVNTVILAAAVLLCIAGARGGVTRMTRPITLSNASSYAPTNEQANLILSNPFCILRTIGNGRSVKYEKYYAPEELARRFDPVHQPADSARFDLSGRNVVIFIMESMSAEHSFWLHPAYYADRETKGFTPFLDSLMRTGLCFRQMFANGTRSIQAMPAVLGSMPSFKTPFVLMPQALGESRQLPRILADRGYETLFLCGSDRGSMGFGAVARMAGIDTQLTREDYEAAHGRGDFDGYWGIWDEPFLQFAGEEFSRRREPFFATLFTLSSHHPYIVPEGYGELLPEGYTRIQQPAAYTDLAFRRFFERFGGEEWFRRTIFVFTADHVSPEKFAAESHVFPGMHHIIGLIYTPDGALQGQVDEIVQQIDLMPTLLGMLGNTEPYFAYGRDIFNEPGRKAWGVAYDSEFRVVTDSLTGSFDERRWTLRPRSEGAALPQDTLRIQEGVQAMIQQYYEHIERKRYTADD